MSFLVSLTGPCLEVLLILGVMHEEVTNVGTDVLASNRDFARSSRLYIVYASFIQIGSTVTASLNHKL